MRPSPRRAGPPVLGRAAATALGASALTSVAIAPAASASQRLGYLQVPLAVVAFGGAAIVLIASAGHLRNGSPGADRLAAAAAETGFAFALLAAWTGILWSRSAEGRWWTWDPLAASIGVLAAAFGAYLAIRRLRHNPARTARWASVAGLAAFPAVAAAYLTASAWPPSSLQPQLGRPALTGAAVACLALGTGAFALAYLYLTVTRALVGRLEDRARRDAWTSVRHRPAPRVVPGRGRPGVGVRA